MKLLRPLYIMLGFIMLGFGLIGIVLPLLPTTPLLLLASFFFMKGSKRFDTWFKGTRIYDKYLSDFLRDKSMTLRQKWTLLLLADAMIAFPFFKLDNLFIRISLILLVATKYYYFFTKIKTRRYSTSSGT